MASPRFRFKVAWLMFAVAAFALGLALAPAGSESMALMPPAATLLSLSWPKALVFPALVVLFFCAASEILLGFPVSGSIYVTIAIVMAGWLWPRHQPLRQPRPLVGLGIILGLIANLYEFPWTTRKPFLQALYSIRRGMTAEEVRRYMSGYMEGTGITMPSTNQEFVVGGALVFRHSNDAAFNADWGVVNFQKGKVASVRFDPD